MCDTIGLPLVNQHLFIICTQGIRTNLSKDSFHALPQRSSTGHHIDATSHIHRDTYAITRPQTAFFYKHSQTDRKSTRLNSSHVAISYAVFCLKKKKV